MTIISAKSGSDWTEIELSEFNICIDTLDWTEFFNTQQLPAPTNVSEVVLSHDYQSDPASVDSFATADWEFFQYMRRARVEGKSAVNDFVAYLLRMLAYDGRRRIIRQRKELSFLMHGQHVDAQAEVAVVAGDALDCLLVVQEGDRTPSTEAQLIASAIAAFSWNASNMRFSNRPDLTFQDIPGIVMIGTAPIFYRIPVTSDLLGYIGRGEYPQQTTVVHRCIPPVANKAAYSRFGLFAVENRRAVFQCFEALKAFVGLNV